MVKNPTITETISLNRLRWFEHVQRAEENRIPPPENYYIWIWKQQCWKVDLVTDGNIKWGRMED